MLNQFAAPASGYNGMRVYFGCYPNPQGPAPAPSGQAGQLCLLFVPTTPDGSATGQDDTNNTYHLYDTTLTKLDNSTACAWKARYHSYIIPVLEGFGQKLRSGYNETRSLWYPMSSISGGSGDIGLIALIDCGLVYQDNPVIGMNVQLGCFAMYEDITKWPYYQLTVIFDFQQQNDSAGMTLSFGSIESIKLAHDGAFPADTGLPCPPFGNCMPQQSLSTI